MQPTIRLALSFIFFLTLGAPVGLGTAQADGPEDEAQEEPQTRAEARRERLRKRRAEQARFAGIKKRRRKQTRERRRNRNGRLNAPIPDPKYVDRVTEQGQNATGFYVTGPFAQLKGPKRIAEMVKRMGLNAVVIDVKDGRGRVTFRTKNPLLQESIDVFLENPKEFLATLKEEGVYTIARITCFADPQLPKRRPDLAIIHSRRKTPWISHGTGGTWLDPYNTKVHDMIVDFASEVAQLGFDEIQLDYIRFPVDPGIPYAEYPAETDERRSQVLLSMMRKMDEAVPVPISADVFGLSAFNHGNVEYLGQFLYEWTSHVEVFSPMIYIHAMRAWSPDMEDRNRMLVQVGIQQMRRRLGPHPVIRPFLQSFDRKTSGKYNPRFIADQIQGARRGGADGFLFWHPGSNYEMLMRGMAGPARRLVPVPLGKRTGMREEHWSAVGTVPARNRRRR